MASHVLDLSPQPFDIKGVRAGDQNLRVFRLKADGVPLDLTGLALTAQARKKSTDPDPPALTADIVVLDAPGGTFSLAWPGDDVRVLLGSSSSWSGVWDLQVQSGTALPVTLLAGSFACASDVTRP